MNTRSRSAEGKSMEFYERRNRTLLSFMEEDRRKKSRARSTGRRSPDLLGREISRQEHDDRNHRLHQLQFSASSMASTPHPAMLKLVPPRSPESPWSLSPMQTPSPSLLYHCIASLHRHEGNVQSIAVSDGVVFTGSAQSSRIRAWKKPDCMERGYIKAGSAKVKAIEAYGNMLFSSHKDNRIRIWRSFSTSENFRSRKIASLPRKSSLLSFSSSEAHSQLISCMAYYHSEELLYSASHDGAVKAWRISDRKCVDSFRAHDDYINGVLVNQEDGCVFTCSSDGSVKIWRRVYKENSHTLTVTLKFQPSPVNAIALSSYFNSVFLYAGSSDGTINFWERDKLTFRFNHGGFLQGHRFSVLCLEAIEKLVFSGSEDTTIRIWRREEGSHCHECLAVMDGHRGPVKCLAACLEMEKMGIRVLVYSGSLDQSFKVWRVKVMAENGEKSCGDSNSDHQMKTKMKMKMVDYEMSPVLSPSWVEKKIQAHPFH